MSQRTTRVAERLKARRLARDMTQDQLARAMRGSGLSHWRQNTVSRIEAGSQEVSLDEARALAGFFGADVFDDHPMLQQDREVLAQRVDRLQSLLVEAMGEIESLKRTHCE